MSSAHAARTPRPQRSRATDAAESPRAGPRLPRMGGFAMALVEAYTRSMQARKTVSILFCDVVDSTPLGEQLDPESLQRVMSRWFARGARDRRAPRRHRREVHRRRGDGRLRRPRRARGRRAAGRALGRRAARPARDAERRAGGALRRPSRRPDRREHGRGRRRRPVERQHVRHRRARQHGEAPRAGGRARPDPDRQGDLPARRERRAGRAARVVPRQGQAGGRLAVGDRGGRPRRRRRRAAARRAARRPRAGARPAGARRSRWRPASRRAGS